MHGLSTHNLPWVFSGGVNFESCPKKIFRGCYKAWQYDVVQILHHGRAKLTWFVLHIAWNISLVVLTQFVSLLAPCSAWLTRSSILAISPRQLTLREGQLSSWQSLTTLACPRIGDSLTRQVRLIPHLLYICFWFTTRINAHAAFAHVHVQTILLLSHVSYTTIYVRYIFRWFLLDGIRCCILTSRPKAKYTFKLVVRHNVPCIVQGITMRLFTNARAR